VATRIDNPGTLCTVRGGVRWSCRCGALVSYMHCPRRQPSYSRTHDSPRAESQSASAEQSRTAPGGLGVVAAEEGHQE